MLSDAIQADRLEDISGGAFNIATGTGVANTSKNSERGSSGLALVRARFCNNYF